MNISRLKKVFAGVSVAAITLTQIGSVLAAYSDVPAGVWYEDAVSAFMEAGYLDESQTKFRGSEPANRAEFVKLVVELNGGILSTPPAVASFDDVKAGAWYYGYMEEAAKEGWVKGDNNCYGSHPCNARPGANINRAEAAALIVRAFGLDGTGDAPQFVDNASGMWYTDVIQAAADHCVLQGDDSTGRVRPGDNMNRAEMVVMLHRVDQDLTFGVDCQAPENMEPMIDEVTAVDATTLEVEFTVALDEDAMVDESLYMVTGDEDLAVESVEMIDDTTVSVTLAESMIADGDYSLSVEDMVTADGETFSDSMNFGGFSEITKGEGTLEVSLASTNPSGDTVPKGANGVVMLSLDLTADCEDAVVLQQITVLHEGFGDESEIDGIYASVDGGRISRKRTLDSEDQTADLRLSEPLTIPACGTTTLDIVADYASTALASAEHNLAVELPSDIDSNAKDVEGSFPMRGDTFDVAAVTSGQMTVTYKTVSPDEVDVGDTGRVLGKFELSANSVEDQTVYSMTFEQNGSAGDADVQNIKVRRTDGTVVTNTAASLNGDFVTVIFDPPFTVLEGDNITLEVVGDIMGGAGDTLQFQFEESSDVFAVGSLYGYGVNGQLYGSRVTLSGTADTITVQAGELTVEIDGPVQQKFTRDDDDAVLANVFITTGDEDVDIQDMFVAIQAESASGAGLGANTDVSDILEDVEMRNTKTGQTVSAVRLTTQGSATAGDFYSDNSETWGIYRFDDFVVKGSEKWELRVDFIDNGTSSHPMSGDKFRAHICTQPSASTTGCDFGGLITADTDYNMVVEGLTTGDDVEDVRPGGTVTGNRHRIASPALSLAVRTTGTTDTAVKNSKNIALFRFEGRAGEAEDLLLTKLIFASDSGSLLNAQNYALWVDKDSDGTVDTILEKGVSAQTGQIAFDEFAGGGYVMPAEESVLFEVHGDISASLTNNDLKLRFDTGSSVTYVEAEEVDDGSSLSGILTQDSANAVSNDSSCTSSCAITVTVATSKLWTLANQGDLFVIRDTSPVPSHQYLGGTLGEPALRLQFRAQNEDIAITDLQITSSGSTAVSIQGLDLYKESETSPFASATFVGCGTDDVLNHYRTGSSARTFCANMENNQLIIKKGENTDILVRPRLNTDENGATSDDKIQLWLSGQAVSDNATGSGAVRGRGLQSSGELTANDDDQLAEGEVFVGTNAVTSSGSAIVGTESKVVLAKITSITDANPDSSLSVPSMPSGPSPIGMFKFTTATNQNTKNGTNVVTLSGVIFTISATNVDMDGSAFQFYNAAEVNTKKACTINGSQSNTGSLLVECKGLKVDPVDTSIDSGDNAIFVLEADIDDPNTSASQNSSLQVSIQNFTTASYTTFTAATSHVEWLDEDTTSKAFYWVEYPETIIKSTGYRG